MAIIFAGGMLVFSAGGIKNNLYRYIIEPGHLNQSILLWGCINALIIVICLNVALWALRNVLTNLSQEKYFVAINVKNVKVILIAFSAFIIANIISLVIFSNGINRSLSAVFANSWTQIFINVIFLAVIYVIYLIFRKGVQLQRNLDSRIKV